MEQGNLDAVLNWLILITFIALCLMAGESNATECDKTPSSKNVLDLKKISEFMDPNLAFTKEELESMKAWEKQQKPLKLKEKQ